MTLPEHSSDQIPPEASMQAEAVESGSRKWRDRINTTIIGIEVSPLNEFGRFGALAIAMAVTRSNPELSALAIGGATAAFEVPAAFAASDALENSDRLQKSIDKVNDFTGSLKEKFGIDKDERTSMPTKIGLAYFGGSAVSTIVKHREDTARTKEQNTSYGIKVASSLVGVSALQGYLIAAGVHYPSPDKIAGSAIAVGSMIGAARMFKSWVKRENRKGRN